MTADNEDTPTAAEDDWAAAMAEQAGAADEPKAEDSWADALSEQTEADEPAATAATPGPTAGRSSDDHSLFKPLTDDGQVNATRDLDMIMEIPITLSVELGQTRLTIRELLDLAKGSIVELEGFAGEPMDILVNGYLIAQGEVVVVDDKYGIRINEIVNRAERIHKLNR